MQEPLMLRGSSNPPNHKSTQLGVTCANWKATALGPYGELAHICWVWRMELRMVLTGSPVGSPAVHRGVGHWSVPSQGFLAAGKRPMYCFTGCC